MRPVNLIPEDQRRGEAAPLRAGVASYAIVGVLAAALVAVIALVLTNNQINERTGELSSLEARKASAEQRASEIEPYTQFASLAQSRVETVSSLADSRFDWERVLHELALVTPPDVWLDSLTGSVAPGAATGSSASGATDSSITGPSLAITGCADSQTSVARFLAALRDIDGVTRVGMQSSSLGDDGGGTSGATTDSAVDAGGSCQTRSFIAKFDVTVAFDAVPASSYTESTSDEAAAATDTATTDSTTTTTTTTTTEDGGVAATQDDQQSAAADEQSQQANNGTAAVGAGQ